MDANDTPYECYTTIQNTVHSIDNRMRAFKNHPIVKQNPELIKIVKECMNNINVTINGNALKLFGQANQNISAKLDKIKEDNKKLSQNINYLITEHKNDNKNDYLEAILDSITEVKEQMNLIETKNDITNERIKLLVDNNIEVLWDIFDKKYSHLYNGKKVTKTMLKEILCKFQELFIA